MASSQPLHLRPEVRAERPALGTRAVLAARIQDRRDQLLVLERQRLQLEAELRAYEDAMALLGEIRPPDSGRSLRNTRTGWREVMAALVQQHPDHFGVKQIEQALAARRISRTPGQIRSRMGDYRRDGLIETAGRGRYRPTQVGRKLFLGDAPAVTPLDALA